MNFRFVCCVTLVFAASTCFAQMYTVTDLGTLGGSASHAAGINASGQVVGSSSIAGNTAKHAFRTAPNNPINPVSDDLGTLGGSESHATGINASGQVVGWSNGFPDSLLHGFRTAPNSPINPATDDLGGLYESSGGYFTEPTAINNSGEVVGMSGMPYADHGDLGMPHAFRTAPNSHIGFDLDTLNGWTSWASAVNDSGQVVGWAQTGDRENYTPGPEHAFRTAANSPINSATDDLGTLGGFTSRASDINAFGYVVGSSQTTGDAAYHAFRAAPNSPINPATDDLGTGVATGIDDYGQVIGTRFFSSGPSFLYSNGVVSYDLNNLIPVDSNCTLVDAVDINNAGQIAANGNCHGQQHAVRLDPIYKAFVQQPINADGSSVFSSKRGVIPVKFGINQYDTPSCTIPATIAITRAAGVTFTILDESIYRTKSDKGSNFRIDTTACQYIYNLAASALGVGTYRVDISINGIMVGHAVFALK